MITRHAITRVCFVLAAAVHQASAQAMKPVLLRGQVSGEGKPLAGASVTFHPAPQARLAVLGQWPELLPRATTRRTVTSDRGRFKVDFGPVDTAVRVGVIAIRQPPGPQAQLGAIVFRPGAMTVVTCQPMAELELPRRCDAHIQIVAPDGQAFYLGRRDGVVRLRLAAGTYRFLLLGDSFALEYSRVRLRAGHHHELAPKKLATRELILPTDAAPSVRLRHWPRVALPIRKGHIALPGGEFPLRLLVIESRSGCRLPRELWATDLVTRLVAPKAEPETHVIAVQDTAGRPIANATVITTHRDPTLVADALKVLSHAITDVKGTASYANIPRATTDLLVFAPGFVAVARTLQREPEEVVELERGNTLHLTVLDPQRQPAAYIDVEFRLDRQPLLRSVARTDARGMVTRTDLPAGFIAVRLRDPRFLDIEHAIRITPAQPNRATVLARPSFQVHGRVRLPGGKVAVGAIVTLRDTTGPMEHARTAVTDAEGSFRITGLPEEFRLRLSARLETTQGAFISNDLFAVPDGGSYELTLKSEDPRFPGRKKDR